jgi:rubrerythrin
MYPTPNFADTCRGHGYGRAHRRRDHARHCIDRDLSLLPHGLHPLSDSARAAVLEALDDEQHAFALYSAILERFPHAMPFAHIVEAEGRHIRLLTSILEAHGIEVPPNRHLGAPETRAAVPASLDEARAIAVEAEIDNVALFVDRLLPMAEGDADVVDAFTRLMEASRDRHLPAFRRWVAPAPIAGGRA